MQNQRRKENFRRYIVNIVNNSIKLSHARNIIRKQLLVQWPNAEPILFNLARNIGDEICFQNKGRPIIVSALLKGTEFYRKKQIVLDLETRDRDIFVFFFKNIILTGSKIYNCHIKNILTKSEWDFSLSPFVDWRAQNQGKIQIIWQGNKIDDYLRWSFLQTILPKTFAKHCPWIVQELEKELFGG